MGLTSIVELDSTHLDLAASLATCAERNASSPTRTATFDASLWRAVAAVGLFDLGAPGDGTIGHLVTGCNALGRCGVYGPIAATVVARDTLPDPEQRAGLVAGDVIATLVRPGDRVIPWGADADRWLLLDEGLTVVTASGPLTPLSSMAGETWANAQWRSEGPEIQVDERVLATAHLAVAAWVTGAATAVIEEAAEYARSRVQFGRPIASFQAVSHPLAMARAWLIATSGAIRIAAGELDGGGGTVGAHAARLAATRRALNAALVAHQAYGALGFISEGPIGATAQRIREMCSIAPDDTIAEAALADAVIASRRAAHSSREDSHDKH